MLKTLRKALDEDKTKTYVVEISPLGLVEMTRQNVTDGVREILTKPCPTCDGEGVVLSEETIAIEVDRASCASWSRERAGRPRRSWSGCNPKVAAELIDRGQRALLHELEEETGKHFHFEGGEALPLDTFEVVEEGTREEIEERALPFQVGEEVLVTIEEPHMYNADDAVASVDSYIVSVTGGGRYVGERSWCGSRRSARSAATASLLGGRGGRRRRDGGEPRTAARS